MGDVQTRILKHILLRMAVALAYLFNTPNDQVVKCRISTFWLSLFHRYKKMDIFTFVHCTYVHYIYFVAT